MKNIVFRNSYTIITICKKTYRKALNYSVVEITIQRVSNSNNIRISRPKLCLIIIIQISINNVCQNIILESIRLR